jgi:DNA helicase-2/ATP-dependent DNA helicase PcrA
MINSLNSNQLDAVRYCGVEPLVIDAGPGAGKTFVLVERVKFLLGECGVDPESLLVITFTRKAAEELKLRLRGEDFISDDMINRMQISTIHSFCYKLLSEYGSEALSVLADGVDSRDDGGSELLNMFVRKHMGDLGFRFEYYVPNFMIDNVIDKFDEYTTFGVDTGGLVDFIQSESPVSREYLDLIREVQGDGNGYFEFPKEVVDDDPVLKDSWYNARYLAVARAYPKYCSLLESEGYLDYGLLQVKALELLMDESVRKGLVYRNILVDEFQDTDPVQMKIFKLLREGCDSFTVVGDEDQSIYAFRGADPEFFNGLVDGDDCSLVTLQTNYRSTSSIVSVNESFIKTCRSSGTCKDLGASRGDGGMIFTLTNSSRDDEAVNIASTVNDLISNGKVKCLSDIGILFRSTKGKIGPLLDELDKLNINYIINGNQDLMEKDEIRSIISLLWYFTGNHALKYTGKWEKDWLNLKAFTSSDFTDYFNLSTETQDILIKLQSDYENSVIECEHEVYLELTGKKSRIKKFSGVFNRHNNVLDEIDKKIKPIVLSEMSLDDLKELGITNPNDLNFFKTLNSIKEEFEKPVEDVDINDKLTLLDLYYKLLNINNYLSSLSKEAKPGDEDKLLNLASLSNTIHNYERMINKYDVKGLFSFLNGNLDKYTSPSNNKSKLDAVQILTVHKSKGLEFPVVIVGSVEEDKFPGKYDSERETKKWSNGKANFHTPSKYLKYKNPDPDLEAKLYEDEEKRILYVAMTRAKDLLILSVITKKEDSSIPEIIYKLKKENSCIHELNSDELLEISIPTSKIRKEKEKEIVPLFYTSFSDYTDCPFKYKLHYNYKFQLSDTSKITYGIAVHEILNSIHSKLKENEKININKLIKSMIDNNPNINIQDEELKETVKNIKDYYNNFASDLNVKGSEIPFNISKSNYQLTGQIDLINQKDDGSLEIIDFKNTDSLNVTYHPEYFEKQIFIYILALMENPEFKDLKISSGGIFTIKDLKKNLIPFSIEDLVNIDKSLSLVASNISKESFPRDNHYCSRCEYKDKVCE